MWLAGQSLTEENVEKENQSQIKSSIDA